MVVETNVDGYGFFANSLIAVLRALSPPFYLIFLDVFDFLVVDF